MRDTERDDFQAEYNVSRETMALLDAYESLLIKWNLAINLISKGTIKNIWQRHFHDSAQILKLQPDTAFRWVDLGSGGGFPGLVLAVMSVDTEPDNQFVLIESDNRKSVFLQTVIRELGLNAQVISERIEKVKPQEADVLTARALAPIAKLLEYTSLHLKPCGTAFFPKGEKYQKELDEAVAIWKFNVEGFASKTNPNGKILKIGGISRV